MWWKWLLMLGNVDLVKLYIALIFSRLPSKCWGFGSFAITISWNRHSPPYRLRLSSFCMFQHICRTQGPGKFCLGCLNCCSCRLSKSLANANLLVFTFHHASVRCIAFIWFGCHCWGWLMKMQVKAIILQYIIGMKVQLWNLFK